MIELNPELMHKLYIRTNAHNKRLLCGICFTSGGGLFCFESSLPIIKSLAYIYLGYSE